MSDDSKIPGYLAPKDVQNVVIDDVLLERLAQDQKWGDQSQHINGTWLAIVVEEVGEIAKAMLEGTGTACPPDDQELRDELVQLAAVSVAWVEAIDRNLAIERGDHA